MADRQYVIVKFRIEDTRTYTYANDGEPVHDGDVVRVMDRGGEGWKKVFVVATTDETPPFECKPIIGLHVEEPDADLIAKLDEVESQPDSVDAFLAERF